MRMNPHSSCEFPIELLTLNISRWLATAGSELVGSGLVVRGRNYLRSRIDNLTVGVFLVLETRILRLGIQRN
jgi:hypothetical protein